MPRSGWFRKRQPMLAADGTTAGKPGGSRWKGRRGAALTAGGAAMVLAAGVAIITFASPGSHAAPVPAAKAAAAASRAGRPAPGTIGHARGWREGRQRRGPDPRAVLRAAGRRHPHAGALPHIAGSWQVEGDTAVFTPASGYFQNTHVTLKIPGGPNGMISAGRASAGAGGLLVSSVTQSFTTGSFTTLGLQQLLSQLGYLPLTWTPKLQGRHQPQQRQRRAFRGVPAARGDVQLDRRLPAGPEGSVEVRLGQHARRRRGAGLQSVAGLTMDGYAGHTVWSDLLSAVANSKHNPNGYTYALASQALPETIKIWHNGRLVLQSAANTGIPASPTADGTFPVYLRYYFQIMQGTNPDGSQYADPVYYVSYFNGGDAVHYFSRGGYGYNQSLGCVELPWDAAKKAYPYLTYGSLVTVIGPVGG